MEEKWTKRLPFLICIYVAMYLVWGAKFGFPINSYGIKAVLIMYGFYAYIYLDSYKMAINGNGIKINSIFRKDTYIPIQDIHKIGLENHPYQIAKVYILFVYTDQKVYKLPTHLFNKKELNEYLSKLCQEKGIEYYINK